MFAPSESDFYRTRLTHSLEVAQIGKGIALRLGADVDLVEAVCLVHDIGHPPFGHAGEAELKRLMRAHGGFEANAQNLRVLTRLENKSLRYRGLNLSRAVIDGQLKYKQLFQDGLEKFVYKDDSDIVAWAGNEASSHFRGSGGHATSFECEIMNLADDIAFSVHDLEDSIHARFVDNDTLWRKDDPRIKEAIRRVGDRPVASGIDVWRAYCCLRKIISRYICPSKWSRKVPYHRGRSAGRKELTSFLIGRYINAISRKDCGAVQGAVSDRYRYKPVMPPERVVELQVLRELVTQLVIKSDRVVALEERAKYVVRKLFEKFTGDQGYYLLPDDWRELADREGDSSSLARVACDYISGMTDEYAQRVYGRLFLPGQGSIFDM